jgi:hypothetical protein
MEKITLKVYISAIDSNDLTYLGKIYIDNLQDSNIHGNNKTSFDRNNGSINKNKEGTYT